MKWWACGVPHCFFWWRRAGKDYQKYLKMLILYDGFEPSRILFSAVLSRLCLLVIPNYAMQFYHWLHTTNVFMYNNHVKNVKSFITAVKVKQSHYRPGRPCGFYEVEAPRFQDSRHMKVVRLSTLRTARLYPRKYFCYRLSQPQGHGAAGRIMSMKNSSDTIGNRTRDLPACSAVPQPIIKAVVTKYLLSILP